MEDIDFQAHLDTHIRTHEEYQIPDVLTLAQSFRRIREDVRIKHVYYKDNPFFINEYFGV